MPKRKYYRYRRHQFSLKFRKTTRSLLFLFLGAGLLGLFFVLGAFVYFAKDLPDPTKLAERQVVESTKIYDRTGTVILYDMHGEEKRTIIPFEEIPLSVKQATLAIEDANFYSHFGLDFKGILRAIWANLRGQKITQGGSTLTQQFIKSSFLTAERTFSRKIKEAILAIEMEFKYPKDKIFEFYLNQIPYGSNAYGIEAAAQTFFNKKAKDLTLAEATTIVALAKAPTYYSPYGSHLEDMKARQFYVLDRMAHLNYISSEQAENAKNEKLNFALPKAAIKAPHFVMFVKEYLDDKYGQDYVEKAGLKVYTTLDWDLQQIAEQTVAEGVKKNEKKYQANNASLVAVDPKTNQVLAMVGSKDYFSEPLPKNCDPGKNCLFEPNVNVSIRDRQPGSAFKPFAYAVAFKNGYTPQTILFDLKTEFNPQCPADANVDVYSGNQCYNPQDYDGTFRGPVTIRQALAQSLNIPSVKVLYLAGINPTINLAHDMGITTLQDRPRYGLSLVLGGGEVKLLDLTSAYSVFANEGVRQPQTAILKIETSQGEILEEDKNKPVRVLEPQITRLISDILSDNIARTPMFGSSSPLYLAGRPVAAKTGTTQEYRDAWTIGYTPSLAAGVWAGNNNNTPMRKEGAGLYAAAPIWHDFMQKAYEVKAKNSHSVQNPLIGPWEQTNEETINQTQKSNEFILPNQIEDFIKPEPIYTDKSILNGYLFNERTIKIDKISGKLATDLTPSDLIEEKKYKEVHTILYYLNKDNPQGEKPDNPTADPQFFNWEQPILQWLKNPNRPALMPFNNQIPSSSEQPPTEYDPLHTPANQPKIKIIAPVNNSRLTNLPIKIEVQTYAPLGIRQIDFFFDDGFIGTDLTEPYGLLFKLPPNVSPDEHSIKVTAYDQALNRQQDEISIEIAP